VLKRRAWLFPLVAASLAVLAAGLGGGTQNAASATTSSAEILFASNRAGAWALYSMNPDGSGQSRFAGDIGGIEPGAQGDGIGVPALTPDGSEVLVPLKGTTAITLATGARRPISSCAGPVVWSPDGKALACSGRSYTSPIYVVQQPGGTKHALPGTKGTAAEAWSPDGNWILFSLQDGAGPYYLWRIHPDGTGLQRVSRYTPTGGDVLWLPDGRAEFVGTRGIEVGTFEKLVVLDVNSGKATVLRKIRTPDVARWSPDGTTLVYVASDNDEHPPAIYTVDVSGGDMRRLTPPGREQYDASPAWSPDGKSLLFVRQTDRGAARYASEIWTMNADGSHQHRLTQPYPDGGENVEPLWVSGPVQVTTEPRAQVTGNTLRVPYLVAGVTARHARVAVAPYGYDSVTGAQPTPPLLVWHPGSQQPESLVGSLCGTITPKFLTRHRLAIECDADFLDEHQQAILDFDLRSAVPAEPAFAYNAYFGPGTQFGTVLDGPVLSGGRIEFETSPWIAPTGTNQLKRSKLRHQILWATDGSRRTKLHSAHRLGSLVTGDKRWLAFEVWNGIEITSPSGRPVLLLRLPALHLSYRVPAAEYLLVGNELIRFGGGTLEGWDVRNGQALLYRSVPAKAQLDAADGQYIVYTIGADLHLISRTGERVIHTPASRAGWNNRYGAPPLHPLYAALSSAGLFYSYDLKRRAFPGRVVFVPRSALPR
jgi:Tol biopolymer transport system component